MSFYSAIVRPLLFTFDSESVHDFAIDCAAFVQSRTIQSRVESLFAYPAPVLAVHVAGLEFSSPIGLAAGFDKNCRAVPFLGALGFSHVEVGSITALPQPGNTRPRIFRLVRDRALINRMGFPSEGAEIIASRMCDLARSVCELPVLGINLGKSKVTPIDDALDDYAASFKLMRPYGKYFVLNVSSPNTPELRRLQEKDRLTELFSGIQELNIEKKPIFIKLAPDLEWNEIDTILEVCETCGVSGLIATNTTFAREGLIQNSTEQGGLSGAPLFPRSLDVVRYIYSQSKGVLPIIGVGGIQSATEVIAMMRAGASLVQIYTGFIYQGPGVVKRIKKDLVDYCNKQNIASISELVGKDAHILAD